MNSGDIIRMAREAGLEQVVSIALDGTKIVSCPPLPELERFANLVAAAEREHCDQLLEHIRGWVEAYPLSIFPEPDFGKAHKVLTENGMTLDAISASNIRHVITQVKEMVDAAIRARGQE